MTTREMQWFSLKTDDALGFFPLRRTADGDYICPKCGEVCTYWEGQIDEDFQGNVIRGWSFDCYPCGITSGVEEL